MVIDGLLIIIYELLQAIFTLELPEMPEQITSVVDDVVGYMVDALPLLWVFFDKSVVTVCLIVALACMNFEKAYDFIMWIIAKIPIGIDKN